jgi:hypothetical protein
MVVTSFVSIALSVSRSVQTHVAVTGRVMRNAAMQTARAMVQAAATTRRSKDLIGRQDLKKGVGGKSRYFCLLSS